MPNVTLTPKMEKMASDAIESGDYTNLSEIVREAMRGWMEQRQKPANHTSLDPYEQYLANAIQEARDNFDPDDCKPWEPGTAKRIAQHIIHEHQEDIK